MLLLSSRSRVAEEWDWRTPSGSSSVRSRRWMATGRPPARGLPPPSPIIVSSFSRQELTLWGDVSPPSQKKSLTEIPITDPSFTKPRIIFGAQHHTVEMTTHSDAQIRFRPRLPNRMGCYLYQRRVWVPLPPMPPPRPSPP